MSSEKMQEVQIYFQNTLDKPLIIAAVKEENGLHIKFLKDLRDYVAYSPYVMNPGDKVTISYNLYKEEV